MIGVLAAEPSEIGDDEPGHVLPIGSIEHVMQAVAAELDVDEDLGDSQAVLVVVATAVGFLLIHPGRLLCRAVLVGDGLHEAPPGATRRAYASTLLKLTCKNPQPSAYR